MKTQIRIPTTQFGYLEFTFEGSPEDAIAEHNRILKLYNGGEGISDKEFDLFIERQLLGNGLNHVETYQQMSAAQQAFVQVNKRALARIKSRQEKQLKDIE